MTLMGTSTSSPSASGTEGATRLKLGTHIHFPACLAGYGSPASLRSSPRRISAAPPRPRARPGDRRLPDGRRGLAQAARRAQAPARANAAARLLVGELPGEVRQECMKRIDEVNAASPTIVAGRRRIAQARSSRP